MNDYKRNNYARAHFDSWTSDFTPNLKTKNKKQKQQQKKKKKQVVVRYVGIWCWGVYVPV